MFYYGVVKCIEKFLVARFDPMRLKGIEKFLVARFDPDAP